MQKEKKKKKIAKKKSVKRLKQLERRG